MKLKQLIHEDRIIKNSNAKQFLAENWVDFSREEQYEISLYEVNLKARGQNCPTVQVKVDTKLANNFIFSNQNSKCSANRL